MKKLILFLICIALLILTLTLTGCTEEKEVMVFRKNITFDDVMILNQEVE